MWQSTEILNVFNTFTLKQIFWKTKTFFKKLEYGLLAESTKIESASFSYKTAISEANVKTNRMGVQNGPFRKNGDFVSAQEPFTKSWFGVPTTQMSIFIHFENTGVLFAGAFSLSIFWTLRNVTKQCHKIT